jgi:hypothetical protein
LSFALVSNNNSVQNRRGWRAMSRGVRVFQLAVAAPNMARQLRSSFDRRADSALYACEQSDMTSVFLKILGFWDL